MGGSIGTVDYHGSLPLREKVQEVPAAEHTLRPVPQQFSGGTEGPPSHTVAVLSSTVLESFDPQVVLSYDARIDQFIVKVMRTRTEEVIRQIPPPAMVALLVKFRNTFRGLIIDLIG